ncbi:holin family protein [Microbulbifer variabilis]|uniref:holin family protein n=1 Tax=Microbulbifer variabilis TaxID=266805 RepID=UPI001CFDCC2D|nr:holin family protein [Microbulbifer variabilis]
MSEYELAIESVRNFSHEGKDFRVANHHTEFLDGSLYLINFEGKDGPAHNFVYIEGEKIEVCKNQALLNELVARKSKKVGVTALLNGLGGISGIIGLIITVAIIYLVIARPETEVPKELWAALTAILAFYFGSKSSKK